MASRAPARLRCSVCLKSNTNRIQAYRVVPWRSGKIHLLSMSGGIIRNPRDPPCRALDVRKAGEGRRKRHVGLRPDGAAARHARADASSRRPRVAAGHQKRKVDDAPRRVEFEEVRIGVRAQRVDGEVAPRVDPGGRREDHVLHARPAAPR